MSFTIILSIAALAFSVLALCNAIRTSRYNRKLREANAELAEINAWRNE